MGFSASLSVNTLYTRGQQVNGQLLISGSTVSASLFNITPIIKSTGTAFDANSLTPQWATVQPILGLVARKGADGSAATTASIPVSFNFYPAPGATSGTVPYFGDVSGSPAFTPTGSVGFERAAQGWSGFTVQYLVQEMISGSSSYSNVVTLSSSVVGALPYF